MSGWQDWIRSITALVIVIGFFEMILPDDDLRRFAKLVMGLVVMLAILQPIIALMNWSWDMSLDYPSSSAPTSAANWQSKADELHIVGARPVLQLVEDNGARQVEAVLLSLDRVRDVSVKLHFEKNTVSSVSIKVVPTLDETDSVHELERRIKEVVARYLQLDERKVDVEFAASEGE